MLYCQACSRCLPSASWTGGSWLRWTRPPGDTTTSPPSRGQPWVHIPISAFSLQQMASPTNWEKALVGAFLCFAKLSAGCHLQLAKWRLNHRHTTQYLVWSSLNFANYHKKGRRKTEIISYIHVQEGPRHVGAADRGGGGPGGLPHTQDISKHSGQLLMQCSLKYHQ